MPAIAAALDAGYRTVAFLDSDSWFRPGAPSLEAIVRGHRGPGAADRDPAVYFAWDLPFSNGPNAGFMLWRAARGRGGSSILWNLDAGKFNGEHDWLYALHWAVAHLPTSAARSRRCSSSR